MLVKDPVCGMECDERSTVGKVNYGGKTYAFCAANCKEEFEKNPERYIRKEGGQAQGRTSARS